jgi:hypothetical protein
MASHVERLGNIAHICYWISIKGDSRFPAVFCSGDAKISCKHELLLLSKLLKLLICTFCIFNPYQQPYSYNWGTKYIVYQKKKLPGRWYQKSKFHHNKVIHWDFNLFSYKPNSYQHHSLPGRRYRKSTSLIIKWYTEILICSHISQIHTNTALLNPRILDPHICISYRAPPPPRSCTRVFVLPPPCHCGIAIWTYLRWRQTMR